MSTILKSLPKGQKVGCVQASWPIPSDLQVIEINAYPLTFLERGSGTPLILVHGSVADYRVWSTVVEPLASRYRVIAPNLRHYYPEPWKGEGGNFSAEQHGHDLGQFAKALNLGKAHWLGWSRGGLVMVEVAKRYPEVVRSLIFEDGAINIPVNENEKTREVVTFTRRVLQTLQNNIRGGDLLRAAEELCDTLNGKGYWSRLPTATRDMILQNIYTALGDIKRPVTTREEVSWLGGTCTAAHRELSPKHYAFYYDEMRKCRDFRETVVIPNAAHAIHADNPDRFLSAVLDFLAVH